MSEMMIHVIFFHEYADSDAVAHQSELSYDLVRRALEQIRDKSLVCSARAAACSVVGEVRILDAALLHEWLTHERSEREIQLKWALRQSDDRVEWGVPIAKYRVDRQAQLTSIDAVLSELK